MKQTLLKHYENIECRLFIIRNGRSQAIYDPVETNIYSMALRAQNMTIENKTIGNLYKIHELAARDGIDHNLAIIPNSFNQKPNCSFGPEYTKALFNVGYPWKKAPPESTDN